MDIPYYNLKKNGKFFEKYKFKILDLILMNHNLVIGKIFLKKCYDNFIYIN